MLRPYNMRDLYILMVRSQIMELLHNRHVIVIPRQGEAFRYKYPGKITKVIVGMLRPYKIVNPYLKLPAQQQKNR